ncbi:uncharacterized protein RJT21DRAFT_121567 [Scheffersomyces amazonensis]|uniref:uncharacterized protein n=1 Tax=Scheffersomyces amazonensis TaxID=1078765 RepID=UPI00315DD47A
MDQDHLETQNKVVSMPKTPLKEVNGQTAIEKADLTNNNPNLTTTTTTTTTNNNNNNSFNFNSTTVNHNQDQTFERSDSSSPFITHPDIPVDTDYYKINPTFLPSPEGSEEFSEVLDEISNQEDHINITTTNAMVNYSASSLSRSLSKLSTTDFKEEFNEEDEDNIENEYENEYENENENENDINNTFHNSTMDTTRYNDTRGQFDQDFDFSPTKIKYSVPLPKQLTSNPTTPWKRLRTASSNSPTKSHGNSPRTKLPSVKQSIFIKSDKGTFVSEENNASTASKIDSLNKQIAGYRMQMQSYKEFLQLLIDKYSQNGTILDEHELANFQRDIQGLSPAQSTKANDYNNLENDYNKLVNEYQEIHDINNELLINLQNFEQKIHEKDILIHDMNREFEVCTAIVDEIIQRLIADANTSVESRHLLLKCLQSNNNDHIIPLEDKLHTLEIELQKRLESSGQISPPPSSDSNQNQTIDHLIVTIDDLQSKLDNQKHESEKLQELRKEIDESQSMRRNFQIMSSKFTELCNAFNDNGDGKELFKLKDENVELKKMTNELNIQLAELKLKIRNNESNGDPDTANKLSDLKVEFEQLNNAYIKLKNETSETITTLTSQLQKRQQEVVQYRLEERSQERLRTELEVAVEKQRKLNAEKIKLSYSVSSYIEKEKELKSTIESLSDKITILEEQAHNNHNIIHEPSGISEHQEYLNIQLQDILEFDSIEFQKLITSFNKIADDSSLKQPIRKYELFRKTMANSTVYDLDHSSFATIRECHKTIFNYFVRAIDILVNDHIGFLLKENDKENNQEYVKDLHQRINELINDRNMLQKQLDSFENDEVFPKDMINFSNDNNHNHSHSHKHKHNNSNSNSNSNSNNSSNGNGNVFSPISKLRIQELERRWKAERERRAYENKEAKRRFQELESENERLRDLLSRQY